MGYVPPEPPISEEQYQAGLLVGRDLQREQIERMERRLNRIYLQTAIVWLGGIVFLLGFMMLMLM